MSTNRSGPNKAASEKTRIEPMDGSSGPTAAPGEHKVEHLVGRKIGAFHVRKKIGQGGMGMVYEAFDPALERKVALKILPPQMAGDAEWVARFMREARTAARLDHPGIARVFAADQTDDGICYIAMQYVEGNDLAAWLRRGQRLPIEVALKVTREIAVALGAAHEAGVVHRDIKPDNVRIEPSGRVVVMDFGLAYLARGGARMTDAGTFLGTPEYCSPEQCEAGATDARSDLYSLGVCLYEMISGRVPHRAQTPYQLFKKIIEDLPVPVREIDSSVPRAVAKVVDTLLAKRPTDRYATAADLVLDLDRLFRHEAVDLAAFHAELSVEEQVLTSARTVELAGSPSQNATWVEDRPGTLDAGRPAPTTTRGRNTRRSFAPSALRSRSRAIAALALVSACLCVGLAAMASLPDPRVLAPVEARAKTLAFLPPIKADRVAILEFRQKGGTSDPELAWLKMCLPEMLSISLAPRLPNHQFVSAASALEALTAAEGREVAAARALGAGLYVTGTYVINGPNAIFYASLNKVEPSSERVIDGVSCQGDRGDFLAVIDDLAAQLLSRLVGDKLAQRRQEDGGAMALHQVLAGKAKERSLTARAETELEERLKHADRNHVADGEESTRSSGQSAWGLLLRAARELQRDSGSARGREGARAPGAGRKGPEVEKGELGTAEDEGVGGANGDPSKAKDERGTTKALGGGDGAIDPAPSGVAPTGESGGDAVGKGTGPDKRPDAPTVPPAAEPGKPGFALPPADAPGAPKPDDPALPGADPREPKTEEARQQGGQRVLVVDKLELKAKEDVKRNSCAMSAVVELCFKAKLLLKDPSSARVLEAQRLVDEASKIAPENPLCVELQSRIAALEPKPTTTPTSVAK